MADVGSNDRRGGRGLRGDIFGFAEDMCMSPVTFPPSLPSQDRREAETRMGLCGVLSYMMFKMRLVLPPFIHLENPCPLLFLPITVM